MKVVFQLAFLMNAFFFMSESQIIGLKEGDHYSMNRVLDLYIVMLSQLFTH